MQDLLQSTGASEPPRQCRQSLKISEGFPRHRSLLCLLLCLQAVVYLRPPSLFCVAVLLYQNIAIIGGSRFVPLTFWGHFINSVKAALPAPYHDVKKRGRRGDRGKERSVPGTATERLSYHQQKGNTLRATNCPAILVGWEHNRVFLLCKSFMTSDWCKVTRVVLGWPVTFAPISFCR